MTLGPVPIVTSLTTECTWLYSVEHVYMYILAYGQGYHLLPWSNLLTLLLHCVYNLYIVSSHYIEKIITEICIKLFIYFCSRI